MLRTGPILPMGQPIRLNPFLFYHNPPPLGPGDTWVQEDVQDRRAEGWDRDLDKAVVVVSGVWDVFPGG